MTKEINYKQTTVTGESWQRVKSVIIQNTLNEIPRMILVEELVTNVGDRTLKEDCGGLTIKFNTEDIRHLELYTTINNLYIEAREARDLSLAQTQP